MSCCDIEYGAARNDSSILDQRLREPDADTSPPFRNSLLLAQPIRYPGSGRSTARTGVLQGRAGDLRARWRAPLGRFDLCTDGGRRRADTDVRHQPATAECASPE